MAKEHAKTYLVDEHHAHDADLDIVSIAHYVLTDMQEMGNSLCRVDSPNEGKLRWLRLKQANAGYLVYVEDTTTRSSEIVVERSYSPGQRVKAILEYCHYMLSDDPVHDIVENVPIVLDVNNPDNYEACESCGLPTNVKFEIVDNRRINDGYSCLCGKVNGRRRDGTFCTDCKTIVRER